MVKVQARVAQSVRDQCRAQHDHREEDGSNLRTTGDPAKHGTGYAQCKIGEDGGICAHDQAAVFRRRGAHGLASQAGAPANNRIQSAPCTPQSVGKMVEE